MLNRVASCLREKEMELGRLIALESGKPITEARAEVAISADVCSYYAEDALMPEGDVIPTRPHELSLTKRFPIGVIGVITPFNFPLSIAIWKMAPALAHGNCVIWKPAPAVIEVSAAAVEIMNSVLPPGVVNLVNGDSLTFDALIASGVDEITFTGSTAVGRSIAVVCARSLIPYQCEMGGKNALVVMRDADLSSAAMAAAMGAFGYAGQKCTSTSRLLIDGAVWDPFFQELYEVIDGITMGDPLDELTTVGPVISSGKAESLRSITKEAASRLGPALIEKKAPDASGAWCNLSVFGPVDVDDELAQTELFGPIAVAMPISDVEHAIEVTDSVRGGLSSSISTRSSQSASEFWTGAQSGMVRVNRATSGLDVGVPFGGEGESGVGEKELGKDAARFCTRSSSIWLQG
jgi:acyl-CoA reductase-like NAD-dependent aldehyde dehydrogenase